MTHCFPERLLNRSDPFDTEMDYRRPSHVARSTCPSRVAYLPGPESHVEVFLGTDAMVLSAKGSIKGGGNRTYRFKQRYVFVAEPKETTEQVRVIGLTDDKVVDGSHVPVSHIINAQSSTAVP